MRARGPTRTKIINDPKIGSMLEVGLVMAARGQSGERQGLAESKAGKQQNNRERTAEKGHLMQIKHLQGRDGIDEGEPVVSLLATGVALQHASNTKMP